MDYDQIPNQEELDYDPQNNSPSRKANYRYDEDRPIDVEDVNFENNDYTDSMMEHNTGSTPGGNHRSGGPRNRPVTGGEGKPNKISQYKKNQHQGVGKDKMGFHSEDKPRHYADDDVRGEGVGTREMSMDDSMGSPKLKNPTAQNEAEIKQAIHNLEETTQVMEVVGTIEKAYGGIKKKLNQFDLSTLESSITVQTLNQCYSIVHKELYDENPNFDQEKMDFRLSDARNKSRALGADYNKFKGEFMAVNESVVNKDALTFKLDRVQRYKEKQDQILTRLPPLEEMLIETSQNMKILKKQYESFEKSLFDKKMVETKYVIKDTNQLIEKIHEQTDKISAEVIRAKDEIEQVVPYTKDQRAKLQQIRDDIVDVENRLEAAKKKFASDLKEKDHLQGEFGACETILNELTSLELIDMMGQSRQLHSLVVNHNDWLDLNKRLKKLMEEEINSAEFDLQKALQDTKKYIDSVRNDRREEYDDLYRQIQRLAKKVGADTEFQEQRLKSFEDKMLGPESASEHIPDGDFVFLKKEVARYNACIDTLKANKDSTLDDSNQIHTENLKNLNKTIDPDDLQRLRQNLKTLQKQDSVDVPRIKRNIDQLEAFCIKALKNQLNSDNRKSQNKITKMKKNYEDLQKLIDALNKKIGVTSGEVQKLKDHFINEDLERENEFFNSLSSKLAECDKDVNGDRGERSPTSDDKRDKPKSLQVQKKGIIAQINKMVNAFNENNKLIKESNKSPKSEKETMDLISKNKEIQEDCDKIEDKIQDAKDFAQDISDRLDKILDPTIQDLKDKYDEKNQLIDECDDLFDKANEKISKIDNQVGQQLDRVEDILARLETVNPLENPSPSDKDNKEFLEQVQDKVAEGNKLRDELEKMRENLGNTRDKLINHVQPLNELGEREVKKPEIEEILKGLDQINDDLRAQERDLVPLFQQIDDLDQEVNDMLEKDKGRKIEAAEDKIADLDDKIGDLALKKEDAMKKLAELKDLLGQAKETTGRDDPDLLGKLKQLEQEAKAIEKELRDVSDKMDEMKKKRNDLRKLIDDVKANPNKFTPQQIDEILDILDDQLEKATGLQDKVDEKEAELDEKIKYLKDLISSSEDRKNLNAQIRDVNKNIDQTMKDFENVLKAIGADIDKLINASSEMKIGAEPDETADYWEERKKIDQWLHDLKNLKTAYEKHQKVFTKKKSEIAGIRAAQEKSSEIETLEKVLEELKECQKDLDEKYNEACDTKDEVERIKKEIDDCEIPVNIQLRRNEVDQFCEHLERLKAEFRDLKQADSDFEGTSTSEQKISEAIKKAEAIIKGFEQEKRDHIRFQEGTLERYQPKDFVTHPKVVDIIIQIREFKARIKDSNARLGDLQEMLNDLNNELIRQDMENASNLLGRKAAKLRERLEKAQTDLKKIAQCGDEMEGNTTHNEEDEFIDALKDEMPEVFKNVDANFDQLDYIDKLLQDVIDTKDIDKMTQLKREVDDASNKVEQSEGLVQKLENEIVEWNALRKLCRRDEELGEIDSLLKDFKDDLMNEQAGMEKELAKNINKNDKEGDAKGELARLRNGIENYMDEISELLGDVDKLKEDKDKVFEDFDEAIPKPVKYDRLQRQGDYMGSPSNRKSQKKLAAAQNIESNKPTDMYYMLHVNSTYKKPIHELLKELRNINQKRRDLEEKYAPLKRDLSNVREAQVYKPVKGDAVDELFAFHLNKAQLNIPVKRLGPGKYLFGTRNILAKIINGKLVIRVGGGYMSADEFIEQYGKMELMKLMKERGEDISGRGSGRGSQGAMDPKNLADMKNMMKQSLGNVKIYSDGQQNIGSGRGTMAKVGKAKNLAELEVDGYEPARFGKTAKSPPPQRSKGLMGSPKGSSFNNKVGSPKR